MKDNYVEVVRDGKVWRYRRKMNEGDLAKTSTSAYATREDAEVAAKVVAKVYGLEYISTEE